MISFEQLKIMQIFNFESFFFSIKICNIYKYVKTKTNLKVILRNLLELRESYDVKKKQSQHREIKRSIVSNLPCQFCRSKRQYFLASNFTDKTNDLCSSNSNANNSKRNILFR